MELPADRALRLQALTRGDEGFVLSMAYSTQRGYGRTHAFVGELRIGRVAVEVDIPELGFRRRDRRDRADRMRDGEPVQGRRRPSHRSSPAATGWCFGQSERKAIAMSLVDRALRWQELGEDHTGAPAQDEEFVLMHCDNIQATGFLEHIKLPHYVDFQAELELVRKLRAEAHDAAGGGGMKLSASTHRPLAAGQIRSRIAGMPCAARTSSAAVWHPGTASRRQVSARRRCDDQAHARGRRTTGLVGRRQALPLLRTRIGMMSDYNFAYLDEQTKRMIRRAILKGIAVPGYQVPFASREMPMPYGWGTGGVQVTAACLVPEDRLKVIDQGADDTTNAVSIRRFFQRTAGVAVTEATAEATVIQTRHRIPETPLTDGQILVYQVPIPEPLRFLEPRETETRKMHELEEYGLMHVKLYEDIARHGQIATSYAYPVKVEGRYVMDPSPIPKFDNPKLSGNPAIQLFGAGREQRIYALPPWTEVVSLDFDDHPFTRLQGRA